MKRGKIKGRSCSLSFFFFLDALVVPPLLSPWRAASVLEDPAEPYDQDARASSEASPSEEDSATVTASPGPDEV